MSYWRVSKRPGREGWWCVLPMKGLGLCWHGKGCQEPEGFTTKAEAQAEADKRNEEGT